MLYLYFNIGIILTIVMYILNYKRKWYSRKLFITFPFPPIIFTCLMLIVWPAAVLALLLITITMKSWKYIIKLFPD